MFNRLLTLAGIATLGAFIGAAQPSANASAVPTDACVDFRINHDLSAECFDGDIAGTYDADHYRVEADTDGPGFYIVVWQ